MIRFVVAIVFVLYKARVSGAIFLAHANEIVIQNSTICTKCSSVQIYYFDDGILVSQPPIRIAAVLLLHNMYLFKLSEQQRLQDLIARVPVDIRMRSRSIGIAMYVCGCVCCVHRLCKEIGDWEYKQELKWEGKLKEIYVLCGTYRA